MQAGRGGADDAVPYHDAVYFVDCIACELIWGGWSKVMKLKKQHKQNLEKHFIGMIVRIRVVLCISASIEKSGKALFGMLVQKLGQKAPTLMCE